ncbi:MAG: hypothetical protein IPI42_08505 [Saprospiraceae bacterium]|nr:hypothetical protein [Candidatus Parvibacillus calidus]
MANIIATAGLRSTLFSHRCVHLLEATEYSLISLYHQNPAFKDVSHGDFSLEDYSPLIDGGVIIPGFCDFQGSVPDIGAIESNKSSAVYESSTLKIHLPSIRILRQVLYT